TSSLCLSFHDPSPPDISPLSLHDALPICHRLDAGAPHPSKKQSSWAPLDSMGSKVSSSQAGNLAQPYSPALRATASNTLHGTSIGVPCRTPGKKTSSETSCHPAGVSSAASVARRAP